MGFTVNTADTHVQIRALHGDLDAEFARFDADRAAGLHLHAQVGFASFLDDTLAQLAPGAMPAHLFTQGVCEHPENPGDLDAAGALRLAEIIDAASDEQLDAAMLIASPASAGENADAIAWVRDLAVMARAAADHGGLWIH